MYITSYITQLYLQKSNPNANSSDEPDIFLDFVWECSEAAVGVYLHLGLLEAEAEHALAAARDGGQAAGVGDIRVGGEGRVGPVKILLGAAAVQLQ